MSTQRFDGRDLDAALARARQEVGPTARVVNAERVRSGGIGGFFARERVEIEVEVADERHTEVAADDAPISVMDLAELVSRAEHLDAAASIGERRDTVAALTGARQQETPADRLSRPVVSTESASFAEILDRLTAESATVTPAPAAPVASAPALLPPAPDAAPSTRCTADTTADQHPIAARRPAGLRTWKGDGGGGAGLPAGPPCRLAELGLPPELVPSPSEPELRDALIRRLADLPAAPPLPTSRGTVVAVVGPHGPAQEVARSLCATLGADPSTVATLVPRRRRGCTGEELTTPVEAADHRRSWRRRARPTIAVVDAPLGRSTEWAGSVLSALEPSVVWGLVDAARKIEDIAAWAEGLGGVDALCVDGVDRTVSPAAPLATGLPVVLLEGEPATPARWAALLLDRVPS